MTTADAWGFNPVAPPIGAAPYLAAKTAFHAETASLHAQFPQGSPLASVAFALMLHEPGFNDAETIERIKRAISFPDLAAARAHGELAASHYCRPRPRSNTST